MTEINMYIMCWLLEYRYLHVNYFIKRGNSKCWFTRFLYTLTVMVQLNKNNKKKQPITVISCLSFTILCYAIICDFNDMLWIFFAMLWDLYTLLWEIEMKSLMIWYVMLCYGMLWVLNKNASIHKRVLNISK